LFVRWDCDRMLSEICRLLQNSPLPVRLYPDQKIREVFCNQGVDFR